MSEPHRPTVLVVEDEAQTRQLIAESLEAAGFAAAQAPDAADALARLDGFAYDGLVVDVQLNGATASTSSTRRSPATRTCGASSPPGSGASIRPCAR